MRYYLGLGRAKLTRATLVVIFLSTLFHSFAVAGPGTDYPILGLVSVPSEASITPINTRRSGGRIMSETGRYVVYVTGADHAPPGVDTNNANDVYLRDLELRTTELLSVGPSGTAATGGLTPSISRDGCRIAFDTSVNLRPDLPGFFSASQVYVRDRCVSPATITRASVDNAGQSFNLTAAPYAISGDGRHVLFGSRFDLSGGGADCRSARLGSCLFVHDLQTSRTVRVDVAGDGTPANRDPLVQYHPDISDNGRFVVFASEATNLAPDDTNNEEDAFLHDRDVDGNGVMDEPSGTSTVRISVTPTGGEVTDHGVIGQTAIAGDGSVAAFTSFSSTLGPTDPNPGGSDVFVRDLATGALELFGRVPDGGPPGTTCCGNSIAGVSADGSKVAFQGVANIHPQPGLTIGTSDPFVRDRAASTTIRVANGNFDPDLSTLNGGISANGMLLVLESSAALVIEDTNGVSDLYAAGTLVSGTTTTTLPASGCGDPVLVTSARSRPKKILRSINTTDALIVLQSAVGSSVCEACVCDVDSSGSITATDALAVLRFAVGQPVVLNCPAC